MSSEIVCRSCLRSQNEMKSIFESDIDFKMRFNDIIKNISNIEIHEEDGMPVNICQKCIAELKRAYIFILKIQTSDTTLRTCNYSSQKIEYQYECCINENDNSLALHVENTQCFKQRESQINAEDARQDKNKSNNTNNICAMCKKVYYNKQHLIANPVQEEQHAAENIIELDEEQQLTSRSSFFDVTQTEDFQEKCSIDLIEADNKQSSNIQKDKDKCIETTTYLETDKKHKFNDGNESDSNSYEDLNEETYLDPENAKNDTQDYQIEFYSENNSIKINLKLDRRKRNSYICNICQKPFTNKKVLNKHIYTHQQHVAPYKCDHCGKDFKKIAHLNVHLRSHVTDEEKPFKCTQCGRRFTFEYLLKQHMHKHADKKPFPCPKCDKGCMTEDSLKRHMKIHDKDYKKPKYACTICQKEFEYPSFLSEHMKNHTGEKPFLCAFCGKGFRQKGAFQYHLRVHDGTRPFQCHICDKTFTATGILKVHMRCHTNERPYICDICGKGFRQCTDMKSHKRTHTGAKLVECSVCQKKLAQRGQLKIHMRMHTGERPFACVHCGREFATNTMLVKHIRIHTGEKPYVCKICGKAFAQSNTLKAHHKVHNKKKEINTV